MNHWIFIVYRLTVYSPTHFAEVAAVFCTKTLPAAHPQVPESVPSGVSIVLSTHVTIVSPAAQSSRVLSAEVILAAKGLAVQVL